MLLFRAHSSVSHRQTSHEISLDTVRELMGRGYDVVVLDTLERGHKQAVLGARLRLGDIADGTLLEEILQRECPEAVMHFAALKAPGESMQQPAAYFRNNVCGMLTLLDTMVRTDIRYCIFSSSCSIFGTPQSLPVTEDTSLFQ